jgi:hypothetical protein
LCKANGRAFASTPRSAPPESIRGKHPCGVPRSITTRGASCRSVGEMGRARKDSSKRKKSVNANSLNVARDMGGDGNGLTTSNGLVATDAFGYSLDYYNGDYRGIGGSQFLAKEDPSDDFITASLNGGL